MVYRLQGGLEVTVGTKKAVEPVLKVAVKSSPVTDRVVSEGLDRHVSIRGRGVLEHTCGRR